MTRGKKPEAAIGEGKSFAERMGYRWIVTSPGSRVRH
jgi:hypothetical protein